MKKVRKAVIPVAGMGTRFLPVTKSIPKEMLPIIDKPILQYIIEEAVNSGIEEILLITSPYKKVIEDHFDRSFELENRLIKNGKNEEAGLVKNISKLAKIFYIRQGEPLGSAHAISLAKNFVGDEAFAVLYGDDLMYSNKPALKQLIEVYENNDASVIGCLEVDKSLVSRYGIIKYKNEETKEIEEIIEKPDISFAPSNIAGLGRYILKSDIFDYIEKLEPKNGEYQLTDAMKAMMQNDKYMSCIIDGLYYDTGSKDGYLKANIEYALRREDLKDKVKNIIDNIKNTNQE